MQSPPGKKILHHNATFPRLVNSDHFTHEGMHVTTAEDRLYAPDDFSFDNINSYNAPFELSNWFKIQPNWHYQRKLIERNRYKIETKWLKANLHFIEQKQSFLGIIINLL